MSFEALIDKVKQAEAALEAHERQASADLRQLKASWTQLWSPGRLLVAGLGSGLAVGLLEPGKHLASGRGTLQMLGAMAGLFAGGSAQAAAGKAEDAADQAALATGAVAPGAPGAPGAPPVETPAPAARTAAARDPEALRRAGLL